ncbi:hypothetical protein PVAP13_7KG139200 [Panicum virgatum]|nr:hypothetical protein PVAP13_7KG139200 [Panicum virgatum]
MPIFFGSPSSSLHACASRPASLRPTAARASLPPPQPHLSARLRAHHFGGCSLVTPSGLICGDPMHKFSMQRSAPTSAGAHGPLRARLEPRLDPVKGPLNPSFYPTAAGCPPSSPALSYLLSSAFSIWKMRWRPRWCGRPRRTAWWQGWRLRWPPGPASRQRSRAVIPGRFSKIRPMWPASRCTVCLQTRLSFWQGEYRLWRGSARRADGQRARHGRADAQEARPSVQVRAHGNLTLALTSSPPPPPAAPWPRPAAAPARRVLHQQPPVRPQRQASRQLQQDEAA